MLSQSPSLAKHMCTPPSAIILELLPTLYSATFPINLWDKVPFRGKSSFTRWVSEHELSNWQGLLMQNVHQHSQHRQRGEANLQAEVTVSLIQKKEKGLVSSFFSRSAFRCSSFFCNYNKTNSILILWKPRQSSTRWYVSFSYRSLNGVAMIVWTRLAIFTGV